MTIEYVPPALEFLSKSAYAKRRLRNREGYVTIKDSLGNEIAKPLGGPILQLCKAAVRYEAQHPEHIIYIIENNCGMSGVPNLS